MITADQSAVIELLSAPATHGGSPVERIDTHASIVFLAGARAWKLKRAVRYDYLDFSDAERRRIFCESEVRINRRAAPALYRGVVPVTRTPAGALQLGGDGRPVEWVIEMSRFAQEDLFDRRAARGGLELALMRPLASAIAAFHRQAPRRPDHGGAAGMRWVIDGNAVDFAAHTDVLDPALCARLTAESRTALDRCGPLLDRRQQDGDVRECHGDLHLRNIVLFDGLPTLFDAIEFNDELSCIDVLYDLAFLLMDLWRRRLPRHASAVWNGYLAETPDDQGLPAMPLFLSCRAAVRAKTSLAAAALQSDPARQRDLQSTAREYLEMALALLRPAPPSLIAIGGFSGSGKSTLAHALAPAVGAVPGAVVVRSDEIRKRLCGVPPLSRLGPEGYTADVSRRVYELLMQRSAAIVTAGYSAIVDAVFAREEDRIAVEQAAARVAVPFSAVWLEVPPRLLIGRVDARHADASDADARVVRRQLAEDTGPIAWHRLDAALPPGQVVDRALSVLTDALGERLSIELARSAASQVPCDDVSVTR
jgi:aminoglycoside phosphotransferase family enzyme/predicted kinase